MAEMTKTITVYFPSREEDVDIEVSCEYEIENDGIGPYEYWGQKCVDKGTDRAVIIGTEWDKSGFTAEEVVIVDKEIDNQRDGWESEIDVSDDDPPERED